MIRIVLINTSHPGNIGSAARAMKTMGLEALYLVSPKHFPHADATMLAAGADDLLMKAKVVDSFDEAIADCKLVIGASARSRSLSWPMLDPRECGVKLAAESKQNPVALVFGREDKGLTNEELQHCHYHVQISASPVYSSLNLAAAVQVLCYEIKRAMDNKVHLENVINTDLATVEEMEGFYQHLEEVLLAIEFIKPQHPNRIMPRLRRLFNRARLDKVEVDILRGVLTEVMWKRKV